MSGNGYNTNNTIIADDYDDYISSPSRTTSPSTPRTQSPLPYGPDPSTEIINRSGRNVYLSDGVTPYNRNHYIQLSRTQNTAYLPYIWEFNELSPMSLNELPIGISNSLKGESLLNDFKKGGRKKNKITRRTKRRIKRRKTRTTKQRTKRRKKRTNRR